MQGFILKKFHWGQRLGVKIWGGEAWGEGDTGLELRHHIAFIAYNAHTAYNLLTYASHLILPP